jgi:hypothetical protein
VNCSLCYREAVGYLRVGGEAIPVCGACGPQSERVLGEPDDDPDGAAGPVVMADGGREAALEAWDEAAEESRTLRALGDLRQHHIGDYRREDGPIPRRSP